MFSAFRDMVDKGMLRCENSVTSPGANGMSQISEREDVSVQGDTEVDTMSTVLNNVCLTEELADVYFSFPGDRGMRIPAHKTLLSLRSPVFKAMFYGTFPRRNGDIVIDDITVAVFETFVRYLYTDKVIFDKDNVIYLMNAANKYQVQPLLAKCGSYLSRNLQITNACTIYCHARFFAFEDLIQRSLGFIGANANDVFMDDDFLSLSTEDLLKILQTKALNIEEVDLFKSLLRWADNKLSKTKKAINNKSRREVLLKENLLYMLAFPALSMEDYTQCVIPSGILSDEEQLQVFKAITMGGPKKPATCFDASPRLRREMRSLAIDQIIQNSQVGNAYNYQRSLTTHLNECIEIQASSKTILHAVTVNPRFTNKQNLKWHLHWNSKDSSGEIVSKCIDLLLKDRPAKVNVNMTLQANSIKSFDFTLYPTLPNAQATQGCPLPYLGSTNMMTSGNRPTVHIEAVPVYDAMQMHYVPPHNRYNTQWQKPFMYTKDLSDQITLKFNITGGHLLEGFTFECK